MNQTHTLAAPSGVRESAVPAPITLDAASITRLLDLVRDMLETTLTTALARFRAPPVLPTPSPTSTGLDLKAGEKFKAADLRFALLTGKVPENSGLLIDTKTLAKLLAISKAHLYRRRCRRWPDWRSMAGW